MYTPTQNAATQSLPQDLTSLDLYWSAPPNPVSPEEYRQLPQQIQFWWILLINLIKVAVQLAKQLMCIFPCTQFCGNIGIVLKL